MESALEKRKRVLRLAMLKRLIEMVEGGRFSNMEEDTESLFPTDSTRTERFVPRGEYKSPADRDTYNYGYTEVKEMTGLHSPNAWE